MTEELTAAEVQGVRRLLQQLPDGEVRRLRGVVHDYDVVGSLRLIRRLARTVYDATITAASGTATYSTAFDPLDQLQHADYHISAWTQTASRPVVTNGMLVSGADISVALERLYIAGPPAYTQVRVVVYNVGAEVDVKVKVWRTPGLG